MKPNWETRDALRAWWRLFDRMRSHPGGTLPDKLASPAELAGPSIDFVIAGTSRTPRLLAATRQHTLKRRSNRTRGRCC